MIDNSTLVLFGARGNLAKVKLIPGLFHLDQAGKLPKNMKILSVGRQEVDESEWHSNIKKMLVEKFNSYDENVFERFIKRNLYHANLQDDPEAFIKFSKRLADEDIFPQNLAFFLSVRPSDFALIVKQLSEVDLLDESEFWKRVLIEKPFGTCFKTAIELQSSIEEHLKEHQIYRIDHYLGKEAVQNLLALRFANTIFEQSWSNSAIDHIQISVAEDLGVEDRGGYYDKTGALKDMVQNHLLQILCLIAMEPPVSISSESVRDEKLKVLKSLANFNETSIETDSVRATYSEGLSKGEAACSYLDEEGVDIDNKTETFVALKVMINNWRWSGVPFYLRTGKRMKSKTSEITVKYKSVPHNIFSENSKVPSNQLVLRIHPDEGIDLKLNTKEPGVAGFDLEELPLDLNLDDYYEIGHQDCYERLLLDVIKGNPALFVRKDEVEASWQWIDNIINLWESQNVPMEEYNSGTWGPVNSDLLLKRDFRSWKNGSKK